MKGHLTLEGRFQASPGPVSIQGSSREVRSEGEAFSVSGKMWRTSLFGLCPGWFF